MYVCMCAKGCAVAAGFAAGSHLDLVLAKLGAVAKQDARKSSSFLDFFKVRSFAADCNSRCISGCLKVLQTYKE